MDRKLGLAIILFFVSFFLLFLVSFIPSRKKPPTSVNTSVITQNTSGPREGRVYLPSRNLLVGSPEDIGQGIVLSTGQSGYYQIGEEPNISKDTVYWYVSFSGLFHPISPPHYFFRSVYDQEVRATTESADSVPSAGGCIYLHNGEEKCGHGFSQSDRNLMLISLGREDSGNFLSFWVYSFTDNTEKEVIASQAKTGCGGRAIGWSSTTSEILFVDSTPGSSVDPSGSTDRVACIYNYDTQKVVYKKSLYRYPDAMVTDNLVLGKLVVNYGRHTLVLDYRTKTQTPLPVKEYRFLRNPENGFNTGYLVSDLSDSTFLKYQFYDLKNNRELPAISFPRYQEIDVNNPLGSDRVVVKGVSPEGQKFILSYDLRNESITNASFRCWYSLEISTGNLQKILCDDSLLNALGKSSPPIGNNHFTIFFGGWL